MSDHTQRYAAFISYCHHPRDRRWALWLTGALETYRTPKTAQGEGVPDRVGQIFREDDGNVGPRDISDQIKDVLSRSDNLIVICSPETPASRWVRREIELFQEMGKDDRIFPVLIAGEPDESFPPELRRRRIKSARPELGEAEAWEEVEPVAADLRPRTDESKYLTERRAVLRLAAGILNCRMDDLLRRDEERRRGKMRRRILAAALVLAALAGGLIWGNSRVTINHILLVVAVTSLAGLVANATTAIIEEYSKRLWISYIHPDIIGDVSNSIHELKKKVDKLYVENNKYKASANSLIDENAKLIERLLELEQAYNDISIDMHGTRNPMGTDHD